MSISAPTRFFIFAGLLASLLFTACSTSRKASRDLPRLEASELLRRMPEDAGRLDRVKGSGRAIVSEPRGTERVTLRFSANRDTSRVLIKNKLGIEVAELMTDSDSLLIYNKVDREAQMLGLKDAYRSRLNGLASINIVQLLQWDIQANEVRRVASRNGEYLLELKNGLLVHVNPENYYITRVLAPETYPAAYSEVHLEAYAILEGFHLPRKITIMSSDGRSRVTFLVQSLDVNPRLDNLELILPDKIAVERL